MSEYKFEQAGSAFGADLDDDAIDELTSRQIAAAARMDGVETASQYREAWAKQTSFSPDVIGVELWTVREGDTPRFTLVYFPDTDGGVLLHAGTAKSAGLMLWQHGFEPIADETPAADPKVLTKAYFRDRYRRA